MDKLEFIMSIDDIEKIIVLANRLNKKEKEELAQKIVETGNAEYIYKFACNVKKAPIEKLAEGVIQTRNAEYIYYFTCNVKGAPIEKLWEGIQATNNLEYIKKFKEYMEEKQNQTVYHNITKWIEDNDVEAIEQFLNTFEEMEKNDKGYLKKIGFHLKKSATTLTEENNS